MPFRGPRNASLENRVCRPDLCVCWRCGGREGSRGTRGARQCCREDSGNGWEPRVRGADEERGDGTADGARRALCREKVGGSTELAPKVARTRKRMDGQDRQRGYQAGPGLDIVKNLGIGKVGGVLVTGSREQRAGGVPLPGFMNQDVGTWEGCRVHGQLLWRAPQDRVPQSQLMGQHPRTQPSTELLWRMPQDSVLRR